MSHSGDIMNLEVRLFATLKDRAGTARVTVDLAEPATVADLLAALGRERPALAPALESCLVAVNRAYAEGTAPLAPGDEVALFPPVSGGAPEPHPTYFALSETLPQLEDVRARLLAPDVGAVVMFVGSVRGETERAGLPAQTRFLEYEAYEAMAKERMAQIAAEIWERWPQVKGVAIVQRLGRLEVGDLTTLVACAAGHRDEGVFAATRYGIDRLKEIVPVWKKEVGPDGTAWVEGAYRPTPVDNPAPPNVP